jgi:hypothetical protein
MGCGYRFSCRRSRDVLLHLAQRLSKPTGRLLKWVFAHLFCASLAFVSNKVLAQPAPDLTGQTQAAFVAAKLNDCITGDDDSHLIACDYVIAYYNKLIKLDPPDASSFYKRAQARFQEAEYLLAASDIDEALRLKPDIPGGPELRASIYLALNKIPPPLNAPAQRPTQSPSENFHL